MINLEKLQKDIDVLLENETSQSLSNWIFKRKFSDLNKILGDGEFVSLSGLVTSIQFVQKTDGISEGSDSTDPTFPYRMAG